MIHNISVPRVIKAGAKSAHLCEIIVFVFSLFITTPILNTHSELKCQCFQMCNNSLRRWKQQVTNNKSNNLCCPGGWGTASPDVTNYDMAQPHLVPHPGSDRYKQSIAYYVGEGRDQKIAVSASTIKHNTTQCRDRLQQREQPLYLMVCNIEPQMDN